MQVMMLIQKTMHVLLQEKNNYIRTYIPQPHTCSYSHITFKLNTLKHLAKTSLHSYTHVVQYQLAGLTG